MSKEWRKGTKRHMIGELARAGKSKREAFATLKPMVEAQIRPMIFSANAGGHREPKILTEQLIDLKNEIGRVYAILGKAVSADFDSEEIETEETPEEISEETEEEISESKPKAKGKQKVEDELRYFLKRVREIRAFCKRRAEQSEPIDSIGVRPGETASVLIPAGIPADALLASMTLHWPEDARNDAGISPYDFRKLSRQIMEEREIDPYGKHELFGYVLTLMEERIPTLLIGPMGTGKSFIARQVAEYLGLDYGETAISAGATRGDLFGRLTASPERPFILAKFPELYGSGGVFNFEEMDAALPEVLIALNNALAGDKFFNSSNGEVYLKHENFVPVATANTFGLGANREYTARERLDAATLDRWRMGRVLVEIDEAVEEEIIFGRIGKGKK